MAAALAGLAGEARKPRPPREPSPAGALRHPRWRARARLEDQRRRVARSVAVEEGLPPLCHASGESVNWRRPATSGSGAPPSVNLNTLPAIPRPPSRAGPVEALRRAIAAMEATPAFGPVPEGVAPELCGGTTGPVRTFTELFVGALFLATSRVPEARRVLQAEAAQRPQSAAAEDEDEDDELDLEEAVSRRLANTSVSRYEYAAAVDWPSLAARSPQVRARFHLSPSGLVNYSLGPPPDEVGDREPEWGLAGEGCWRVLPEGGLPTEVTLEMLQGFSGRVPPIGETPETTDLETWIRRPFRLRVNLRRCVRVIDADADEEEEDDPEDDDDVDA